MGKRIGNQTLAMTTPVPVAGFAAVAGKKEGQGPLTFDYVAPDATFGEKTWEKAESKMQRDALDRAMAKAGVSEKELELLCAGDLINQCIASAFGTRGREVSFLGLYGACSTMAEGLGLAACMIDGGFASCTAAVTSSHFCSAERQYRFPLEYGGQRTPTAQWTVTGAGAAVLKANFPHAPCITHVTFGQIVDFGIRDANNMGAAMAPAAHQTLTALFADTGTEPADYDLILTGDLAAVGKNILIDLFASDGVTLAGRYDDCGCMIFDGAAQDTHAGGSGCGCGASVLCCHVLNGMRQGQWKRVIFAGTGALMSPVSSQQGESIPSVCHAVVLEYTG
ncbi:MAG: stage V sporulation protein AD [Clostridiaceae bacterium]|nr:stage V sporulation protein AD [Clostridiaceae bacterium]MDY3286253.1 stage V sporulation protein AD [Eubacteriales bacterium]MDY5014721.1 stage V sporulation protein AD [Eubacteriales bacterium]